LKTDRSINWGVDVKTVEDQTKPFPQSGKAPVDPKNEIELRRIRTS